MREEVGVSDPVKRFRPKPFWQDGAPSRGGLSYRLAGNEQMFERHAVAWPPGSAARDSFESAKLTTGEFNEP